MPETESDNAVPAAWRRVYRTMVRELKQQLRRLRATPMADDDPTQQAILVAGERAHAAMVRALCQASRFHDGHTCVCARIACGAADATAPPPPS